MTIFRANHKQPQQAIEALEHDGCVVIESFASSRQLDQLNRDLKEVLVRYPNCEGPFVGYLTKRIGGLFLSAPITQDLALAPLSLAVMDRFLLPNCNRYQINLTQAIQILPGERAQYLHRDQDLFGQCIISGERMINVMIAATDFTAENGATLVAPGSNNWEPTREPEPHEVESAEMRTGSALIYLGSTFHAGGANNTDKPRLGIVISYCLGWLRQAENQYLSYPPSSAVHLREDLLPLIGYSVHRPNVGLVANRDPAEAVLQPASKPAPPKDYLTDEQNELLKSVGAI